MNTMRKFGSIISIALVAFVPSQPTIAQDFSSIPYNVTMTRVLHRAKMKAIYGDKAINQAEQSTAVASATTSAGLLRTDLQYQIDPTVQENTRTEFIERVRKVDPVSARSIEQEFSKADAFQYYQLAVTPYGVKMRDPIDSMTAYLVLCWLIANDHREVTSEALAGVRRGVAEALEPGFLNLSDAELQAIDEELMYRYVVTHGSWRSAVLREGPKAFKQLSDITNAMWRNQFDKDLRELNLTPNDGFVARN